VYFIIGARNKKAREKSNVLQAYFEIGVEFLGWGISLLFNTLFTLGYYLKFFSNDFPIIDYLVLSIIFICLLLLAYYWARWKVIIVEDRITFDNYI